MNVTLLTQEQCSFCDQAKQILERIVPEFGLTLRVLDIGSDEGRRLAEQGGVMFPPGIFIDGEPFGYGRPSERRLRRELEQRAADRPDEPLREAHAEIQES